MLSKIDKALSIDRYALTVALSLFKQKRHNQNAYFEIFYRKPPCNELPGVVFAGPYFVQKWLKSIDFDQAIRDPRITSLSLSQQKDFVDYMSDFNRNSLEIESISEGTLVPPSVPVMTLRGSIAHLLLFEAPMLSILHLASAAATTAFLFGKNSHGKDLLEMGLRRSFGPESAAISAFYASMTCFKGSSNMAVESMLGQKSIGTMSHAYILSFEQDPDLSTLCFPDSYLKKLGVSSSSKVIERIMEKRKKFGAENASLSELKAFLAYAIAFPGEFTGLVDTYDTLDSGLLNVVVVASFLSDAGYSKFGLRLDSGDLCKLSIEVRRKLNQIDQKFGTNFTKEISIVASNDIGLSFLKGLESTPNELDKLGVGTQFSTFSPLNPIGFVYKLAEIESKGVAKTSNEIKKSYLPFKKSVHRALINGEVFFIVGSEDEIIPTTHMATYFKVDPNQANPIELHLKFDKVEPQLAELKDEFKQQEYRANIDREYYLFGRAAPSKSSLLYTDKLMKMRENWRKSQ